MNAGGGPASYWEQLQNPRPRHSNEPRFPHLQRTRRFEGSGIAYANGSYFVVFDSLKWVGPGGGWGSRHG